MTIPIPTNTPLHSTKTPQNKPLTIHSTLSINSECCFLPESEQQNLVIYFLYILELLLIPMIHMSDSLYSSFQVRFFLSISKPNGEAYSRHCLLFITNALVWAKQIYAIIVDWKNVNINLHYSSKHFKIMLTATASPSFVHSKCIIT